MTFVLRPTTTYRAIELGLGNSLLGLLSACFALAPLILALPSGSVTDRVGERVMAFAGAVLVLASALTLATLGTSIGGLVAGTVLLGLGHLGSVIAEQTWVANRARGGRADSAFGKYTFAASLGQSVGPALLLFFGSGHAIPNTGAIFASACVAALLLLLVSLGLKRTVRLSPPPGQAEVGTRQLIRLPGLARALLTSCVVLAAVDITLVYVPALGAERGIAAGTIGVLLAIRGLASMASRIGLGALVARLGRRRLLVTFTLLAASAMALAALPLSVPLLAICLAVTGFGLGVGQPLTMSWLSDSAPAGARGKAMSLRLVGNRAGQVFLPAIAGTVAASAGAGGVLAVTSAGLVVVGMMARRLPLVPPG
ncbi:MFS transporter [Phycicoccus sonneratiae]|uniref:MFS transporter n=1 Tax=Phycicoccus sonneratiae TaxID=2807628 RepID=A0ABS2CQP5_9MICO|nr:MFS transporter [Phycicoccus sonneraticus]MBM6402143.1 MFS transporter [Phycicoccus sonneraticus]